MILQVRSARPELVLNGADYFSQLAPYFLSLSYTDNCNGQQADDLHISLADRDKKFVASWMPDVGTFIDVAIIAERWFAPNASPLRLDCGRLWFDTVDFELPENTVSIKGNSLPTDCQIKTTNETRGWEKSTLRDIAQQIAGENKMSVMWDAQNNPRYTRVEQQEESGLQFLKKRCDDAKLSIKIHRQQVVIFDPLEYEKRPPQFTLLYGTDTRFSFGDFGSIGTRSYRLVSGHLTLSLSDVQKGHKVAHSSPMSGKTVIEKFNVDDQGIPSWENNLSEGTDTDDEEQDGEGDGGGGGETPSLLDETVPDWQNTTGGDFQVKAKAATRDTNKHKWSGDFQLGIGNPLVAAGQTFNLQGAGQFDGVWFAESIEHTLAPTYTTKIKAHKVLEGY